jgi:hypothetical protein
MTNQRPFLKLRLSDTPAAREAARIVDDWKRQRAMSRNLVAAVRLYASLLRGDVSVLTELFPGFALGSSVGFRPPPRQRINAPIVEIAPPSEADQESDLLGVLDDNLEF